MKYYKLTLLKDLPNLNAGFSVVLSEEIMEKSPYGYYFPKPNSSSNEEDLEYSEQIDIVWEHRNDPEWVKVEFDLSKAVQIRCPNCGTLGMFTYEEPERCHSDDGVYRYYVTVGLLCPHCEHQLSTHTIHTRTKV